MTKQTDELQLQAINFHTPVLNAIENKKLESVLVPALNEDPVDISIQKIIHFNNGGWSALGIINDDPLNSFVLSYSQTTDKVIASIQNVSDHSFYEIRFAQEINQHVLIEKDPHK